MADIPVYAYVKGAELHQYPAYESCNLDDATEVEKLTAAELEARELVAPLHRCARCFPIWTDAGGKEFDVLRDDPDEDATTTNAG